MPTPSQLQAAKWIAERGFTPTGEGTFIDQQGKTRTAEWMNEQLEGAGIQTSPDAIMSRGREGLGYQGYTDPQGRTFVTLDQYYSRDQDPAKGMQTELAHMAKFGIPVTTHPEYGPVVEITAANAAQFEKAHPKMTQSSLGQFLGGLVTLAGGMFMPYGSISNFLSGTMPGVEGALSPFNPIEGDWLDAPFNPENYTYPPGSEVLPTGPITPGPNDPSLWTGPVDPVTGLPIETIPNVPIPPTGGAPPVVPPAGPSGITEAVKRIANGDGTADDYLAIAKAGLPTAGAIAAGVIGGATTPTPNDGGAGTLRTLEDERAARAAAAAASINSQFAQFGEPYYSGIAKAYNDYQTPLFEEQYGVARRGLPSQFATTGSSAYQTKLGQLEDAYQRGKVDLTNQGLSFANDQRSNVENERAQLLSLANSGLDATAAGTSAATRAAALMKPPTFAPAANIFQNFTGNLANQAIANQGINPMLNQLPPLSFGTPRGAVRWV